MNTTMNSMNTARMSHPDMFHDEAAHKIEWRLGVPALVAAAILSLYAVIYYVF